MLSIQIFTFLKNKVEKKFYSTFLQIYFCTRNYLLFDCTFVIHLVLKIIIRAAKNFFQNDKN